MCVCTLGFFYTFITADVKSFVLCLRRNDLFCLHLHWSNSKIQQLHCCKITIIKGKNILKLSFSGEHEAWNSQCFQHHFIRTVISAWLVMQPAKAMKGSFVPSYTPGHVRLPAFWLADGNVALSNTARLIRYNKKKGVWKDSSEIKFLLYECCYSACKKKIAE